MLSGVIPAIPTPLTADESVDTASLLRVVRHQIRGGVHGLWVLGTTGRFDLVSDSSQRVAAETVCEAVSGSLPIVLNVSDLGTRRTLEKAARFDDLPVDAYAVLPPWFERYSDGELLDHFGRLADELTRPLVIYNADWTCNVLPMRDVMRLASHPRIIGIKDTNPAVGRCRRWTAAQRHALGFAYLHGTDRIAETAVADADGVVGGLAGLLPALAVQTWQAARNGDATRAAALEDRFMAASRIFAAGSLLACLEAAYQNLGLVEQMSGWPQHQAAPDIRAMVAATLLESGVATAADAIAAD
jgi:dihydrodipicolinate synthase/N-acetylneuraminate lyase